jgi:hypothetical protein
LSWDGILLLYDEVMMYPESNLAILTQELVRRESRDDPTKYQANIVRQKEEANAKKPKHPSTETVVKQVLAVQGEQNKKSESGKGTEAAVATSGSRRGKSRDRRNQHWGSQRGLANIECWHCGKKGHVRTGCFQATPEQIAEWQSASSNNAGRKTTDNNVKKNPAQNMSSGAAAKSEGNE